ncbi:uncharacterized protein LOC120293082 [Eucalyptus grandis]|uniref:uncharacterized protein LOC120293082 n=1 Tax=Eucalyptus grandis TaxID=71139 RepID=UPI00192EDA45|nr:uncharacterized protein LOC120293082 [Eucalyptus grandis]
MGRRRETWKCLRRNILVSQDSGDGVVIVQRTQNCIYNEWKGFSWWTLDLQAFLSDPCRNKNPHLQEHDGSQWPAADYVVVNMDGQGIGYLLPQYSPTAAD